MVMTLPLLEGLDGVNKMSKSLGNYIGVTESPKDIFGKSMSISDDLMWRYFTLVLNRPEEEVAEMKAKVDSGEAHPRDVKDQLGQALVAKFYSEEAGAEASTEFKRVFAGGQLPEDIQEFAVDAASLDAEGHIGLMALMTAAGLTKSNGEARRLIQQGAVRINDEKAADPLMKLKPESGMIIKSGKRGFVKLS